MSLTLVTAPTVNPVTNAEVYEHLRVPLTGSPAAPVDESHITALISAAVGYVDAKNGVLGRALVTQTWDMKLDRFPAVICVPLPPLQSVTSITYVDSNGDSQTLSSLLYTVDTSTEPARIIPAYNESWPSTRGHIDDVTIRFVAGYAGDGASPEDLRANVPFNIKAGIKVLVNELYQNRGDSAVGASVEKLPFDVMALLAPFRVMEF